MKKSLSQFNDQKPFKFAYEIENFHFSFLKFLLKRLDATIVLILESFRVSVNDSKKSQFLSKKRRKKKVRIRF